MKPVKEMKTHRANLFSFLNPPQHPLLFLAGGGFEFVNSKSGKVISVSLGECTKKISIDGSSDAIKDAITAVFGLRSKRAF